MAQRFKQKIQGYVGYAASRQHEARFHTTALTIALFGATEALVTLLKRWTEDVLQQCEQPEEGERFFFTSRDPATTSPTELSLTPVWEQAFGTAKTPLLVLEDD
jgi:hypothetical protein